MKSSQIEFLKLVSFLNDLAHDSLNGFEEISCWNKMECNKILYDSFKTNDSTIVSNPVMVPDPMGVSEPRDASTLFNGVRFGVVQLSTGQAVYVVITKEDSGDVEKIIVKDGRWWFE